MTPVPAAREQAGSSQRAPAWCRQSRTAAVSAGRGLPASLSISVPKQSQFCQRCIPRSFPTETTRHGQSDTGASPVNSSSSTASTGLFHRSVKQLILETSDLPRPTLLRRGNETFLPERGEKPEGTRNREVGNELHGSVSQARLKIVACCRRCPGGPPALCQKATGAAAAGSGQPQSSGRGGTRRRAETSPGGGEAPRGDTRGGARTRGTARRPRSGADPRPSRGSLCQ